MRRQAIESLAADSASKKADPKAVKELDEGVWEPALRKGNRLYDRMAAALRLERRAARVTEVAAIDEDLKSLKADPATFEILLQDPTTARKLVGSVVGDSLIGAMLPAIGKVGNSCDRVQQAQRNLHIAFALAAYRSDNHRYPPRLDDLAPKYLAAIPADLFSGKPLIYRPTENGYLFYSVGVNGKDDGGRFYDDDPPGDDLGVRMPLPPLNSKK
jgi:hypothetical protein